MVDCLLFFFIESVDSIMFATMYKLWECFCCLKRLVCKTWNFTSVLCWVDTVTYSVSCTILFAYHLLWRRYRVMNTSLTKCQRQNPCCWFNNIFATTNTLFFLQCCEHWDVYIRMNAKASEPLLLTKNQNISKYTRNAYCVRNTNVLLFVLIHLGDLLGKRYISK